MEWNMELFNKKIGVLVGIILIGIIATSSLYAVGRYSKGGFVLSRAQIKGSNGKPIFVEVNANGDEVREIGETIGELDGAYVVSGSSYKESLDTYINFRLNNLSLVNGAVPLRTIGDNGARSEYQSYCRQLPAISLPASSPDAPPTTHSVPCPQVDSDVKSVLIRGPTTINSAETLGTDGPIIYKSEHLFIILVELKVQAWLIVNLNMWCHISYRGVSVLQRSMKGLYQLKYLIQLLILN